MSAKKYIILSNFNCKIISLFAMARPALCPSQQGPASTAKSRINPLYSNPANQEKQQPNHNPYYRRQLLARYRLRVLPGWGSYFV
jgi:hypothetical protein